MKRKIIPVLLLTIPLLIWVVALSPARICPTESLEAVTLNSPAMWSTVDSLTPTLQWNYPSASCTPQGYAITLRTGTIFYR